MNVVINIRFLSNGISLTIFLANALTLELTFLQMSERCSLKFIFLPIITPKNYSGWLSHIRLSPTFTQRYSGVLPIKRT